MKHEYKEGQTKFKILSWINFSEFKFINDFLVLNDNLKISSCRVEIHLLIIRLFYMDLLFYLDT